jgi:dihydropyrimidinase
MKCETLIKGGKAVIPKVGIHDVDICIDNGKIAALVSRDSQIESKNVIDAAGKYIFPGVVDPHVHWGYSGTVLEEVPGESRAAAIGGCTTVINYPVGYDFHDRFVPIPNPDDPPSLDDDLGFAAYKGDHEKTSYIDFAFHFKLADEARMRRISNFAQEMGITSFKFYMAYTEKEFRRSDIYNKYTDTLLYDSMRAIGKTEKGICCVHCENSQMLNYFIPKIQSSGEQGLSAWNKARPDIAEAEATNRALFFSEMTGCPTYIVHLTCRRSLDVFSRYRLRSNRIYGEAMTHHLLVSIDSPIGILAKNNPPIRTQADCEALWEAVIDGQIDTIASDCCAARLAHKQGNGDIWTASAAYPGPATNLPLMISEGYHKRGIDLVRIAELTSYNAGVIFHLYPRKGTIMVGSDADLAIVDLNLEQTVTPELLQGYCDYSIWTGWKVKGWPVMTLLRGETLVQNGRLIAKQSRGKYLRRS